MYSLHAKSARREALARGLGRAIGAVVLLVSASAAAKPGRRQSDWAVDNGAGSVTAIWSAAAVTAGDMLVAGVTFAGGTSTTVTPPAGWTLERRSDNGTAVGVAVYYIQNCPAKVRNTTEVFTVSGNAAATVQLNEFTGVDRTAGAVDVSGAASGNTTPASVAVDTSPDSTSELAYALVGVSALSTLGAAGNGFSAINSTGTPNSTTPSSATTRSRPAFVGLTGAGSTVSTTVAVTAPTTTWAAVIVSFKLTAVYWIGSALGPGACTGHFEDDACWSSQTGGANDVEAPDLNDVVIFDDGATGDCQLNPGGAGSPAQAYSIEVQAGYTGTVNQITQDLQLQRNLTISGGTFSGGSGLNIEADLASSGVVNGTFNGSLTVNGGTLNGNGGILKVKNLIVNGGTFAVGAGGLTVNGTATVAGGTINVSDGAANPDVSSTKLFTQTGGTINLGAAQIALGTTVGSGGQAFNLNGGTFNAGTGTVTVTRVTTLNGTGTFNGATATETLGGTLAVTAGTMNLGTAGLTGNTTVGATGALSLGTPGVSLPGRLTMTGGTFNGGSGTSSIGSNVVMTGGTFNAGSGTFTITTSLGMTGGAVNAQSSRLTITTTTALDSSATFNGGTAAITFSGAVTITSGTMDLTSATPTFTAGATTVSSGGTLTLGASGAIFPAALTVDGTFNAGSGTVVVTTSLGTTGGTINAQSARLTITTTTTLNPGTFNGNTATLTFGTAVAITSGTMDLTGATPTFSSGNDTVGATGTLTLGASGTTFPANLTITGGTLNAGSGPVAVTGTTTVQTAGTFNGSTATLTFGVVSVTGTSMNLASARPTFNGAVTVGASGTLTLGSGAVAFGAALTVTGGTFNSGSATLTVTGTTAVQTSGTFNGNTATIGFGAVTLTSGSMNLTTATPTFGGAASISGTLDLGGTVAFNSTLTVAGGTFNAHAAVITVAGTTTTNASGAFNGQTATITFNGAVNTASGTLDLTTAHPSFTAGTVTVGAGSTMTLGSQTIALPGNLTITGGTFNAGATTLTLTGGTTTVQTAGTFNGGTASITFGAVTVPSGSLGLITAVNPHFNGSVSLGGGTLTLGSGTVPFASTLDMSGGTFNAGGATITVTGNTTVDTTSTLNANSSNLTFNGSVTLGTNTPTAGTFNAGSATVAFNSTTLVRGGSTFNANTSSSLTFANTFTLQTSSAFNGNTASGTFQGVTTLTSGTFSLGDSGTAGHWSFQNTVTVSSGATLSFPDDKGWMSVTSGKTVSVSGTVYAHTRSGGTAPKIDCTGCSAGGATGVTYNFLATAVLDLDGFEFHGSVSTGIAVSNGAAFTTLKRVKFTDSIGGAAARHIIITENTLFLEAPGCYFDSTNSYGNGKTTVTNVQLVGDGDAGGKTRMLLENRDAATNGPLAGHSHTVDNDVAPVDGYGDTPLANGAVVQWITGSPSDTAGTIEGFPTAAFDWNTFTWYGVYVAYRNVGGAATSDRILVRQVNGDAGYYFDVPQGNGDIIGTPRWDSIDERTAGDQDGDGLLSASVHVVYIPTTAGYIYKLIDSGTTLAPPVSGNWVTPFSSGTVASITSPLVSDRSNLYFGGTNASAAATVFGVQIATGAGEKTVVKNIAALSTITAAPAYTNYFGTTYLYLGSVALAGQAYIYRMEVSPGAVVNASSTAPLNDVFGSIRVANQRAYAVDGDGKVHALDAGNFNSGGFANLTGFPYQDTVNHTAIQISAHANAIHSSPYVLANSNGGYIYFGDDDGHLYVLKPDGTLYGGFPYYLSSTEKLTASPIYGSGVIAVGTDSGSLYLIDQHNASSVPAIFYRYTVGGGAVSSVGYNANTASYMVGTADGKLTIIAAQADPTPTFN